MSRAGYPGPVDRARERDFLSAIVLVNLSMEDRTQGRLRNLAKYL